MFTLVMMVFVTLLFESALRADDQRAVSFVNDVMPVLTKSGCNAGVCHAKAGGGQNGFQLSLLGFEPQEDLKLLLGQRKLALQKQVLFRVEGEQRLGYGCGGALVHAFAPHVLNHQPSSRHS